MNGDMEEARLHAVQEQADGYRGEPLGRIHPGESAGKAFGVANTMNAFDKARERNNAASEGLRSQLQRTLATAADETIRRERVLSRLTLEAEQTIYLLLDLIDLGLVDIEAAMIRARTVREKRRRNGLDF